MISSTRYCRASIDGCDDDRTLWDESTRDERGRDDESYDKYMHDKNSKETHKSTHNTLGYKRQIRDKYSLQWNMVDIMSFFSFLRLQYSFELLCELPTSCIERIQRVYEKCMNRIFSRPCDKHFVDLTRISLSMFIFSYPDTDIELS